MLHDSHEVIISTTNFNNNDNLELNVSYFQMDGILLETIGYYTLQSDVTRSTLGSKV